MMNNRYKPVMLDNPFMSPIRHNFRVITFNLLTQYHAKHNNYPMCEKKYLSKSYREQRVLSLIERWTKANFIICFQELTNDWITFFDRENIFSNNQYSIITASYSGGRWGVGIAYPLVHFTVLKNTRINIGESVKTMVNKMNDLPTIKCPEIIKNELADASDVDNCALSILFMCKYQGKINGKYLMVSTYHMPCCYDKKFFMFSHLYFLKRHLDYVQTLWTDECNIPREMAQVLAGDFNMLPNSDEYTLMTSMQYSKSIIINVFMCILEELGYDTKNVVNFWSAHSLKHGCEPQYTNISLRHNRETGNIDKFIGCIDYIFVNNYVNVRSSLVGLVCNDYENPYETSYPNARCPSDHMPLSSSLII